MAKLITPEIFRKNTAEDYLKAAIDTAEWIDTLAIKTEYGRIWQALPEGQDGYRDFVPGMTVGGERSRPELSVIRDCMLVWQVVHPLCSVLMRRSQVRG